MPNHHDRKYQLEDVRQYYPLHKWYIASRLAWPGVDPGLTRRVKQRIDKELGRSSEPIIPTDTQSVKRPSTILTESVEVNGDTQTLSGKSKERIHTLDQLLKFFDVDSSIWDVDRFVCNKWEVAGKDNNNELQTEDLYQVKAWFKRKITATSEDRWAQMIEEAKAWAIPYPKPRIKPMKEPVAVEIAIADPHIGKQAWKKETGWANYDLSLAVNTYQESLDYLIDATSGYTIEKFLLPLGNDYYHVDNRMMQTERGTQMDTDSRYQKIYHVVFELARKTIDTLSTIAPVDVIIVPGNHDQMSMFHTGRELLGWYRNAPGVHIQNDLTKYHPWTYGDVFITFTHGEKSKVNDYFAVVAAQYRELWGRAKYCEIHTGHLHSESVTSHKGGKFRRLPSLTPPDAWHVGEDFVGNLRSAQALIYNRQRFIGMHEYSLPD